MMGKKGKKHVQVPVRGALKGQRLPTLKKLYWMRRLKTKIRSGLFLYW
jgi:hypothetical protein